MSNVIVAGGGAAGMFAAIAAAGNGHNVFLVERNEKLGKKLYITGKGRCNLTNSSDMDVVFSNINSNPKFLYAALNCMNNQDVINFFENIGMRTKVERGNRVFPASDKSSDLIQALSREINRLNIHVILNTRIDKVVCDDGKFRYVVLGDKSKLHGDALVIATGGLSYPTTGSTGDGFEFAGKMGHTIISTQPSLVPLLIQEEFVKDLQGLSLKNVRASLYADEKLIFSDFGEMLFTHFGVSGPLILSASAFLVEKNADKKLTLKIDLKPALDMEQLDHRILKDFSENVNKSFKNALDRLLPKKLIPVMIELSGIPADKKINEITKAQRLGLAVLLKSFPMTVTGKRGYSEAVITKGGVSVREINPSTMQSKRVEGVYFAGEVIDIDAMTGGYNLQLAWSTGWLAGISIK
ncbi:BaiN/RdsA family NAD(P)/FAD-dependent oxidoreductase [Parasporobacterium paucivorans]|uniref:Aminoacetone oxidase family FAD-binding enzyme n=1 Tax=Parasporobacterium paucivorans DSM 15970 TaxID=1122934 RepID=A0A1M6F6V8_9FIRM|nr:NAD(P)/FAD-dependent oxidoreductase [Parasporobacterium paucivorans]SHI93484.1 hypothetical protein SAMN02745691_01066 [Parasporobacterium paucivorans DSM 15970]